MNLAKSQGTKSIHRNHLHFYILTTKNQKREIKESLTFTIATKIIKYLWIKLPKETKELYTENYNNTDETNQTWHKQMQIYSIFLGRKNQYCENDYTTKCNLQIQCDSYQITNGIFHRTRTKKFTIDMETQKALNSLEKEGWSWRNQPSWIRIIIQSYSHQDSMVMAQKQKHRPMEQDRKPRNKPMHLWVPYFWQRRQEYTMGQREPLQ